MKLKNNKAGCCPERDVLHPLCSFVLSFIVGCAGITATAIGSGAFITAGRSGGSGKAGGKGGGGKKIPPQEEPNEKSFLFDLCFSLLISSQTGSKLLSYSQVSVSRLQVPMKHGSRLSHATGT